MSEKNAIRSLIDSAQQKLNANNAEESLAELNRLEEMGSEDGRVRLMQAMALAMMGKNAEARHAAEAARASSQNILAEVDALLSRLK